MDKQEVTVRVKSRQEIDGEKQDVLELVTVGTLYQKGDKTYIAYDETKMTGMEGTKTTVKIEKNRVTLIRLGTVNAQMVFEAGKRHDVHYETPEGVLFLGADCKKLSVAQSDGAGKAEVSYLLSLNGTEIGVTEFEVSYEKRTDKAL